MNKRDPNQDQNWYCDLCEKKTIHKIFAKNEWGDPTPSDWYKSLGVEYYKREGRRCTQCGEPRPTVEMTEKDFNSLVNEVNILREFESSIKKHREYERISNGEAT